MTPKQSLKKSPPDRTLRLGVNDSGAVRISVVEYSYSVQWLSDVSPSFHYVAKDKICQCKLGKDCPSVIRVREYLETGGKRAPEYPDDFWASIPSACPICEEKCSEYPLLDFKAHGKGWTCSMSGTIHYWEARLDSLLRFNAVPLELVGVTVAEAIAFRDYKVSESHARWKAEGYRPWD